MAKGSVRVDKWLWAVRIFKSRSIATRVCKSGKVRMGEQILKPSASIQVGDIIELRKEGFNLTYKVLQLIDKRVGYSIAVECYENLTPDSELNKFKDWFVGKGRNEIREKGKGRPTKKERREIELYKAEIYLDEWFDQ